MMGGRIEAQSTPGKGSTFSFTLEFETPDTEPERRLVFSSVIDLPVETLGRLQGHRVLLVEDNLINQQIASEILREAHITVEVVGNGREALEILRSAGSDKFAAVLMDVQMPQMNGYEATRLIRRDAHLKTLPVIAITAHAMAEERDKCLAAGMNDHVAKPIDPALLLNTLARWMTPRSDTETQTPVRRVAEHGELPSHLPGLDVADGVKRVSGSSDLYRRLVQEFVTTKAEVANEIRHQLSMDDLTHARELVHGIKGIAGNLSATTLHHAATTLDEVVRKKQRERIPDAFETFERALHEALSSMRLI